MTSARTPEKKGPVKHDKAPECSEPSQRRNMQQSEGPSRNQRPDNPRAGGRQDGDIDCLGAGSGDEFTPGMA